MHPLKGLRPLPPSPEERDRILQNKTESQENSISKRKYFDKGVIDDYDGSDENAGDPPEVKRVKRIDKEIEKLRKKYPDKSRIELQNLVAQKYQNNDWYRGGFTYYGKKGDSLAMAKSHTTSQRNQTLIVISLYAELKPADFITIEGNKENFPFGKAHKRDFLKDPSKFEVGSLEGSIDIFFDDLTIPDRVEVVFDGNVPPVIFDYGDINNPDDNKQEKRGINCNLLNSTQIKITVRNNRSDAEGSNFDIQIIPNNVNAKLKKPILRSVFVAEQLLDGKKRK